MRSKLFFMLICLATFCNSFAAEKHTIRIGVQTTGTVDWELSAVQSEAQQDFQLDILHLANPEAGKIALQSGAVDMIVSDWIWVSRLRANGSDFTFYPYSTTSGALLVPKNSAIQTIKDLKGKRLGIAGGELDKNWLLLQALGQQEQIDLNVSVEKTFGAPPLISEQLRQNRVDAILTYWNFAARLESETYKKIIDGKGILKELGITETAPVLGYVFKQSWAEKNKQAVNSFLNASQRAKNRLCTSDADWEKVIPLTKADDAITQAKLRQGYCEGGIGQWGEQEQQAASRIYLILRSLSHNQLTGQSETIQSGTFWSIQ